MTAYIVGAASGAFVAALVTYWVMFSRVLALKAALHETQKHVPKHGKDGKWVKHG